MSIPVSSQTFGKLDLEVHIPAMAEGKCGCFFWRKVTPDTVSFDAGFNKLVVKEKAAMSESDKTTTRLVISRFIMEKCDSDPASFAVICKFINFDPDKSQTIRIRQIQALKEVLEAMDKERLRTSSNSPRK